MEKEQEKTVTIQEVNRKNTMSVEQAINDMYIKIAEQKVIIEGLHNTISSLNAKINSLEQMVFMQKAKMVGTGPTVLS